MRTFQQIEHDRAGVDVERLQTGVDMFRDLAVAMKDGGGSHTDIARLALREAAAQIHDNVLPVLLNAIDDLKDEYGVSERGATDADAALVSLIGER